MAWIKLAVLILCSSFACALYRFPLLKKVEEPVNFAGGKEPLFKYYNNDFYGEISIGDPPQCFNVSFETFTSDIWIPGSKCDSIACFLHRKYACANSTSCDEHKTKFELPSSLSAETLTGVATYDRLCFGCKNPSLCVENQGFAQVIREPGLTYAFAKYDGIFGLGFESQSAGNFTSVISKLIESKQCDEPVFAFYFSKDQFDNETIGGEITICGIDKNQYEGELFYSDIVGQDRWQIRAESISLGDDTAEGPFRIRFGTGNYAIQGPTDFVEIIYAMIGAKRSWNGQFTIECDKVKKLDPFIFKINGKDFEISPFEYIRNLQGTCVGAFVENLDKSNDWTLGNIFMNRYYTVFDLGKNRIGLAKKK